MADAEIQYDEHVKAFFLALAAKGKEAWNVWRRDPANRDVPVTFAGIDFSEAPRDGIDFSGFEFGDDADFSRCVWRGVKWDEGPKAFVPGRACFTGAVFGDRTTFVGAAFGNWAAFDRAVFSGLARFDHAAFGQWAAFNRAVFGDLARFHRAAFGNWVAFDYAVFGDWACFAGATFGVFARFAGAAFGDGACFDRAAVGQGARFRDAAFGVFASFAGAAFDAGVGFDNTVFKGSANFTGESREQRSSDLLTNADEAEEKVKEARIALTKLHEDSWERRGFRPDRFLTISFADARFHGEAVFSGRTFEADADFTDARFYYPPDFDAVTNASRIDFTGAHIGFVPPGKRLHWTKNGRIPVRLRAFRKIAEETKNHDLERDLYIEERKAERGVYLRQLLGLDELKKNLEDINKQKKHVWLEWRLQRRARNTHWLGILAKPDKIVRLIARILWIFVMGVYWALADYGRSFARPAAWLVSSGFFFYWRYTKVLAQLMAKAPDVEKYKQAVRMLALGNTVPFVGPLTIDSEIKRFLFCPGCNDKIPAIPPEGYQLLVVGQNLFSITYVFFIGLALRNYFRIK